MKKLVLILLNLVVCSFLFGNSNEIITGVLKTRAIPCPIGFECPAVDIFEIKNDTASFVLIKDGQYVMSYNEFGNYPEGDIISFFGKTSLDTESDSQPFYKLDIKAWLSDASSGNYTANCIGEIGDDNQSTLPTIMIENDSIIIQQIKYDQCCAEYALRISEIINDTLYVTFSDTASEQCDCMCNFEVRISAMKLTSQTLKIYYNGVFYDLNTSNIEQINNKSIQIYPNPTKGIIKIKGIENQGNLIYEIYNTNGQIIQKGKLSQPIDLSKNKKGIYILSILRNKQIIAQEKIIIE